MRLFLPVVDTAFQVDYIEPVHADWESGYKPEDICTHGEHAHASCLGSMQNEQLPTVGLDVLSEGARGKGQGGHQTSLPCVTTVPHGDAKHGIVSVLRELRSTGICITPALS